MKIINFNSNKNSIIATTLSLLGVKHTSRHTNSRYNSNPFRSNLLGISKIFSDYGVENVALKLLDKASIVNLTPPFIAHASNDFVIVKEVTNSSVKFVWGSGEEKIDREEFDQIWSGIVLTLNPTEDSIEPGYEENRRKEIFKKTQLFLIGILFSVFLTTAFINNPYHAQTNFLLSIIVNIIGCFIALLLVQKQININSNLADKLCSVFQKGDCNSVLESTASKFMGLISWSEIGFGYFISNLLILLFFPNYIPLLFIVNILVLPYSIWSIWYQRVVAKQWCVLCVISQIILWAIFFVNIVFRISVPTTYSFYDALILLSIYMLPTLIISLCLPIFIKSKRYLSTEHQMKSLMLKPGVFFSKLKEQSFYEVDQSVSNIIFGNKKAQLTLTVLTNPYCFPCSIMHTRIENLLDKLWDKVNVQYIFTYFDTEDKEDYIKTNRNLIRAYLNNDINHTKHLYSQWFEAKNKFSHTFFNKYHFDVDEKVVEEEFRNHESWKINTGLRATPTILVNGYLMPDEYKLEDLEYIVL